MNFKFLNYLFFFFFNLSLINCVSYISEIQFGGVEYLELYSDSFLNLSDKVVIDESLKNNSLELIKYVNESEYYLLVGSKFLSVNDLSNLNCSVYKTKGTQVSNGGLRNKGESFSVGNFSFNLTDSYNFEVGTSLNYVNGSYIIGLESVCGNFIDLPDPLIVPVENTGTNISCGDYGFDVILEEEYVNDKLEFKFNTNYSFEGVDSNYLLNYWIEDYSGVVVKGIRNSTSLNWKTYSPKGATQILRVFGELDVGDCIFSNSKYVSFYSNYVENITENPSYNKDNSLISTYKSSSRSYVKLINIDSVLNLSSNYLEYEIYRGKSRKSVVNFYLNSKVILNLKLNKYEKISGKIYFDFDSIKYIKISGLGFDEKFNISKLDFESIDSSLKDVKNLKMFKESNQFFKINEIKQDKDVVYFNINTNLVEVDSVCYVNRVRTIVSNTIHNVTKDSSLMLDIDKLNDFEELKLLCKYKKSGLKTYKYESILFNFSKDYIPKIIEESISTFNSDSILSKLPKEISKPEIVDVREIIFEDISGGEVMYSDRNSDFIETSTFFVLVGTLLFIIPLVLFW